MRFDDFPRSSRWTYLSRSEEERIALGLRLPGNFNRTKPDRRNSEGQFVRRTSIPRALATHTVAEAKLETERTVAKGVWEMLV